MTKICKSIMESDGGNKIPDPLPIISNPLLEFLVPRTQAEVQP